MPNLDELSILEELPFTSLSTGDYFPVWDASTRSVKRIAATEFDQKDPLHKFDATAIPTTNDDANDGYAIGSLWIDIANNEAYRCVDSTVGAAIWIETTFDAVEVAALITANNTANVPAVADNFEVPSQAVGTFAGQKKVYHIKSDAGGNLTLDASILTASDSGVVFPKPITAGKLYIVQLVYGSNGWMLSTLVGGY